MESLKIILSTILLIGFAGLGLNNIIDTENKFQFKEVELKSKTTEIKELNLRYNRLNEKLEDTENVTDKQLNEIQKEKSELEREKQKLERQLQAKLDAKEKRERAIAKASEDTFNAVTGTRTASAYSGGGTKEQWMAAAGIPQSDWQYVNCVIAGCNGVSAEGGWNGVQRWNTTGSGAYGLCQALPASKMASAGADWETNPITQLKWCHSYAQGYGSWAAAWAFRQCLGSCYSPRTNSTVMKDHTWW